MISCAVSEFLEIFDLGSTENDKKRLSNFLTTRHELSKRYFYRGDSGIQKLTSYNLLHEGQFTV